MLKRLIAGTKMRCNLVIHCHGPGLTPSSCECLHSCSMLQSMGLFSALFNWNQDRSMSTASHLLYIILPAAPIIVQRGAK